MAHRGGEFMVFRFKSISLAATVAMVAVFGGAAIHVEARAASFDCTKAQTPTETMICDKPELSRMDDQLGQLFRQVRSDSRLSADARENILVDQRAWLGRANGCTDTGCLEALYAARIDQLQEQQRDIAGGATDGEAEVATSAPELLGDPQRGRTVGTENPETSTPAIVVPADLPQLSLQTLNLIAGAILVGGVFLAIAGPMSAGHIHRRFGYRVFLNWNVAIWLLGHVIMLGALVALISSAVPFNAAVGIGLVGLLTWLAAIIRNIRRTNLFVGLWVSLIQMPWSLIAIFGALLLNGMLHTGERERAGQERMRRKGIID